MTNHLNAGPAISQGQRRYYDDPIEEINDTLLQPRYFCYHVTEGLVAGAIVSVRFNVPGAPVDAWPYIKDFNLWQNPYRHFYSGVIGDLEGRTCRISDRPDDPGPHQYQIVKVIPECLIVVSQPIPADGVMSIGLPGFAKVSPGFHVLMIQQERQRTSVSLVMEHASLMEVSCDDARMSDEDALEPWRAREMVPDWVRKWRDDFVPTLRGLIGR